jgi:molybdenum cofactor cytidylyltransferase
LLAFNGQSLLQHAIEEATASKAHTTVVVLGARAEQVQKEMDSSLAQVVINERWEEGMASSIQIGVKALMEIDPAAEGLILMMCDQPFVTTALLNDLVTAYQKTGKPIVTCSYADTFGPPTLFHKSIFPELLQLKGDVGARSIIKQHANEVEVVLFPQGNMDVDTEADYQKLLKGDREQ